MTVGYYCNRDVVIMAGNESVRAAARLMRDHHVGDVVIVEERRNQRIPVGIVTDRDIVVEVMAAEVEPDELLLRDLVTTSPFVAREDDTLFDALEMMRRHAIRRIPVVNADGGLEGILTADDVIGLLAELCDDLAAAVQRQPEREARRRPSSR